MQRPIIIGARGSALSRCQAQLIQTRLEERFPARRFVFKAIAATADQRPDISLTAVGEEGIFVKELEAALVAGEIDCAVHSLKDLPLATPSGLMIAAITEREDARDVFISRSGQTFEALPAGSKVGTSSPRRRSQLRHRRSDLECLDIRGNVDTRLRKLQDGRYDAIVLAACGLIRLGLEERITEYLPFEVMLPEPGQGALAIETRRDDAHMLEIVGSLNEPVSRACVEAERAFLASLGGGCHVPIAAYAEWHGDGLRLTGAVIAKDGSRTLRDQITGSPDEMIKLGVILAQRLLAQGAKQLL